MDKIFIEMIDRFESELHKIFERPVKELIIHGSVVDGGFIKGKGDIDFIVFVEHEITEEMFNSLKDYHRQVRLQEGLEHQLEGCYLSVDAHGQFIQKGVYIGTGEKGWKCFDGDIFSVIDKSHISQLHYEHKKSGLTKTIFHDDWDQVVIALKDQLKQNVEMLGLYDDWDFRLHLLHTTARSMYSLAHNGFASKRKSLEWLETRAEFIDYHDYIHEIMKYKSKLSAIEKTELDKLGHEMLEKIVLLSIA